jgi:hypothetical protein
MNFYAVGETKFTNYDWVEFDSPIVNSATFRLTHTYIYRPWTYCNLQFIFTDGVINVPRVYPDNSKPSLLYVPTLEHLIAQGFGVFYSRLKLSRTRQPDGIASQWQIKLEAQV